MEQNNRPVRYCIFCGRPNNPAWQYCNYCGKELYPKENQLKDYAIKEIKDQVKDQAVDFAYGKLKHFLLAHLYGIVLTASVVFTGVSAVSVLGRSGIPKDARQVTSPPVVDILGNITDGNEEALPEERRTVSEDSETAGIPEEEAAADAVDPMDVYRVYLALLPNAEGDPDPGYYIYDIDKNGIPELLLTVEDPYSEYAGITQGLEVWYYDQGTAKSAGIMWGFAHGRPAPASLPDCNGVVFWQAARNYECIWTASLEEDGTVLSENGRTDENSVYIAEITGIQSDYYDNAYLSVGEYDGHPYRAVTESPFFEGSELLGFSRPTDDTALKEALGL